ncbi:thiopeptide-type bacteriocin biosynthesis protein [Aquimarina sp. RZ0]|uniref:thiopeptide-type bacteriocin biosynthesis protein n=1 Tax=Aquimarina sp. RZ0 TaxID=2607730 RepID=UPI0011F2A1DC|nr:thiopeptide-type bacteriocin biosynthesis protein [Aquimarina sp. RZ0]KAA1247642.1 hypothetical protein F0000_02210 [Aquimarina sp. RZ0]
MDIIATKRIFIAGDTWLYYKIYCGERSSDLILTKTIRPLVAKLIENRYISHWFFIRYQDPDFHIRIRFHLTDVLHIGSVILHINKALQSYVQDDIIYKVQLDTYIREIERYGAATIAFSEKLFSKESDMLLQAIEIIKDDTLFFLFVIKAIDTILTNFKYSLKEKVQLTSLNRDRFKEEFLADKKLTKQLDKKYRTIQHELYSFFSTTDQNEDYLILYQLLHQYTTKTEEEVSSIINCLTNDKELQKGSLISSYIHMLVNRAFRSKQRFYELVCYDFLTKYYKSSLFSN